LPGFGVWGEKKRIFVKVEGGKERDFRENKTPGIPCPPDALVLVHMRFLPDIFLLNGPRAQDAIH
jgi:hypothetical protein